MASTKQFYIKLFVYNTVVLIGTLWNTWQAEIHEAVQKRMRHFSQKDYPEFLSSLEQEPTRKQDFLSVARTDLKPFIDAIRRDNRRLANEPECAHFCLQKAVREVAAVERSRLCPHSAQTRVYHWVVDFHEGCQRDTEKWPRDVRDELEEKCDLLRERGSQLTPPLVKPLAGSSTSNLRRLRLHAAGGAYRIVFAQVEQGNFLLLAGGKKGGFNDDRFYQDMKATATRRINLNSEAEVYWAGKCLR